MEQVNETADNQSVKDFLVNKGTENKGKYACPQCATWFTRKSNLAVHFRRHRGVRTFQCPHCPKSFVTTSELKAHEWTHSVERPQDDKERPFSCTLCQKSFTLQYTLTVHMRNHTGERPYKCSECSQAFASRYNLEGHIRTHTGEKPHRCSECPRTFSRRYHLLVHMRAHARGWQYKCSQCPNDYCSHQGDCPVRNEVIEDDVFEGEPSEEELYSEVKEEPYDLQEETNTNFVNQQDSLQKQGPIGKDQLEDHDKSNNDDNDNLLLRCPNCPKTFQQKPPFKRHLLTHNEERPFKCTRCQKAFKQVRHLRVHQRTHTAERPFKCSQCPCTFEWENSLRMHLLAHTKENTHTCPQCSMIFTRRSTLNKHLKEYCKSLRKSGNIFSEKTSNECCPQESSPAGRNEEPTNLAEKGVCTIPESLIKQSKINAENPEKSEIVKTLEESSNGHEDILCQIKEEDHLFQDKVCTNPEKSKEALEFNHQVQEEMYEEFVIEELKGEPTNKLLYKDHIGGNIESLTKDNNYDLLFKCSKCPKTFQLETSLKTHLLTHSEWRPHACSQCSKAFKKRQSLLNHIRIHTGERPYKCAQCPSAFASSSPLKRHVQVHTGEKPYTCTECSTSFTRRFTLNLHMAKHSKEPETVVVPSV